MDSTILSARQDVHDGQVPQNPAPLKTLFSVHSLLLINDLLYGMGDTERTAKGILSPIASRRIAKHIVRHVVQG
jgi:hypothetical protein